MRFGSAELLETLDRLEQQVGEAERWVLGFSGGLDSTVLAEMLCQTRDRHGKRLLAVHVDHQLQPESASFAAHCAAYARARSLPMECITANVGPTSGKGPEAAARDARYAALAQIVGPGDWLLSAHHRDDQAETLLLNLLRGSGPLGIAGIPAYRRFADGWLLRPLLDVSRSQLEQYAERHKLEWVDDPSNDDSRFDRNFLRHEVLPKIGERWPDASGRLARSAALARDASALLDDLADIDLQSLADAANRLSVPALEALSSPRRRNVLRYAARRGNVPVPAGSHLDEIERSVIAARSDAGPVVCWPGGELRRFRNRLYLMPTLPDAPISETRWVGDQPLDLGPGLGRLRLERVPGEGLDPDVLRAGLAVRQRVGGEKIRTESQSPTRTLKNLLNEYPVVPWLRDRLPLLYCGDQLVAVADLWVASDARGEPGLAVRWDDRPALN